MATHVYKALGQDLLGTSQTTIYTVPGGKSAIASSITFCNTGSADTTFRFEKSIAGAATAAKQRYFHDCLIPGNGTIQMTSGVTLGAGDILRGLSANGLVACNVDGDEMT